MKRFDTGRDSRCGQHRRTRLPFAVERRIPQRGTGYSAHRRAKNLHTDTALLDAVSEEINNSIFRKGHVALGVSSALIGSGMAFDYNWFCNNITQVSSAGEDKELEVLLLKQGIFIEYLDDVEVLDEKTAGSRAFYNQRRRWLAAQWYSLKAAVRDLPGAVLEEISTTATSWYSG
ncbi:MAG: glycosyltransferase family 2 protein [Alistipes indistinctus]